MRLDERQFLEAYDRYADAIYRHCWFRVHDRELARDLTQETFLRAWKELSGGKEIRHPQAFLYQVATRLVIDWVRRKKEDSLEQRMEQGREPGEKVEGWHAQEAAAAHTDEGRALEEIRKAVEELAEPLREAFVLRYVEEMLPREIAEMLGENANVISVRIHRAVEQVRRRVGKDGNPFDGSLMDQQPV